MTTRSSDLPSRLQERGVLAALTGLAFAVRWAGIGRQSLWFDETVSAFVAGMGWREGADFLLADGVHPPFYYVVQKVFFPLGISEAALRFPAAVFGTLAVPLLWWAASRWAPRARGPAALLLAISPLAVWYSREARMYSLLMLLSLAGLTLYADLLMSSPPSKKLSATFVVAHALLYLTHYFGGMVFLIELAHLAITLRRHSGVLRRWTLLQVLAWLPCLAWVALLAVRGGRYFGIGWIPTPGWRDLILTMINFSAGYSLPLTALHWATAALLGTLAVFGLRAVWRAPSLALLAGLWAFLPIALGILFSAGRPLYVDRFFLGSLPPFLLLAAQGWTAVRRPWRYLAAAGALALVMASLYRLNFGPGVVKEQWREAGAYLSGAGADEIVIPRVLQILVPLSLYYQGEAPVRALEVNREVASLSDLAAGYGGVWLVYWNPSADAHDPTPRSRFDSSAEVDAEAASWIGGEASLLLERRDFVGVTVLHLEGPAPP